MWFGDQARVGQKNKITRRWARRGTRPAAPHDQRTASTYIFGAICPRDGKGAGLVLPRCNTAAMSLHLAEIATVIAPNKHVDRFFGAPEIELLRDFIRVYTGNISGPGMKLY